METMYGHDRREDHALPPEPIAGPSSRYASEGDAIVHDSEREPEPVERPPEASGPPRRPGPRVRLQSRPRGPRDRDQWQRRLWQIPELDRQSSFRIEWPWSKKRSSWAFSRSKSFGSSQSRSTSHHATADDIQEADDERASFISTSTITSSKTASNPFDISRASSDKTAPTVPTPGFALWTPRTLTLPFFLLLFLFASALFALASTFLVLSERHSGFPPPRQSSPLSILWTFGPPAALLVLSSLWLTMDRAIRRLLPWAALSVPRGQTASAMNSVMLAYAGNFPGSPWTIAQAWRSRHWTVILSTLGIWLLGAATVASTSVWSIKSLTRFNPSPAHLTSTFDAANVALSVPSTTTDVTPSFLNAFLGHWLSGTPLLGWTTTQLAVTPFAWDTSTVAARSLARGSVPAYSANLECATADATYAGAISIQNLQPFAEGIIGTNILQHQLSVNAGGCQQTHNFTITAGDLLPDAEFNFGYVFSQTCEGSTNQTVLVSGVLVNNTLQSTAAAACTPQYDATMIMATVDLATSSVLDVTTSSHPTTIDFPSGAALVSSIEAFARRNPSWIQRNFSDPTSPFFLAPFDPFFAYNTPSTQPPRPVGDFSPWFYLLAHTNNGTVDLTNFLPVSVLTLASQTAFTSVFPQLLLSNLLTPSTSSESIAGSNLTYERRLLARMAPLIILQATLGILLVLTSTIAILRPAPRIPHDPSSLAFIARVMEQSADAREAMRYTSAFDEHHLSRCMAGWRFAVQPTAGTGLVMKTAWDPTETYHIVSQAANSPMQSKFWKPLALRGMVQLFLIGIVIAIIAGLEGAQRYSDTHDGWSGPVVSNGWTYVPAAVLALLGAALAWSGLAACAVEPFLAMQREPQPAARSLAFLPFAHSPLTILLRGIPRRFVASTAAALAAFLVVAARIAVAGLFIVHHMPAQTKASIALNTEFANSFVTQNVGIGEQFALMQLPNKTLGLPAWTTQTEALAEPDVATLARFAGPSSVAAWELPILFSELGECETLQPSDFSFSNNGEFTIPETQRNCPPFDDGVDGVNVTFPTQPGLFGAMFHITCDGDVVGVFGKTVHPASGAGAQITAIRCPSFMTAATANVTINVDGRQNGTLVSVSRVANGTLQNYTDFENGHDVQQQFLGSLPTNLDQDPTHSFDGFVQIALLRQTAFRPQDLLEPTALASVMSDTWSAYWALLFSTTMRTDSDSRTQVTINHISTRTRQRSAVTIILQSLLGGIVLCLLAISYCTRGGLALLLKPPYSIAAQMSVLEGSKLVERGAVQWRDVAWGSHEDLHELLSSYLYRYGGAPPNVSDRGKYVVDLVPWSAALRVQVQTESQLKVDFFWRSVTSRNSWRESV